MGQAFPQRNIKKNAHAETGSSGRIRKLDNFKMAMSMGYNFVDLDKKIIYHIQEYYDALHNPKIPKSEKPTQIRMTSLTTGKELGWADEWKVAEKMKDPEPDPRY